MREEGISEKEEMVIIKTIPAAYAKIKGAFTLVNDCQFSTQLGHKSTAWRLHTQSLQRPQEFVDLTSFRHPHEVHRPLRRQLCFLPEVGVPSNDVSPDTESSRQRESAGEAETASSLANLDTILDASLLDQTDTDAHSDCSPLAPVFSVAFWASVV